MLIAEYYQDLRDGVNCISEGDFDSLQGVAEDAYAEKAGNLVSEGKIEAAKKIENEGKTVNQVIERLKRCHFPSRVFDEEGFNKLLSMHSFELNCFEAYINAKDGLANKTMASLANLDRLSKFKS